MNKKELLKTAEKLAKHFRVTDGKDFRLRDYSPGDTHDFGAEDKPRAQEALTAGRETLAEL
jgi:hypothetical protein